MSRINKCYNHKIKIIHVMQNLEIGGMENGVVNLCNQINRSKFIPVICCLKGFGPMGEYLKSDVKVINMDFPDGRDFTLLFKMIRYFKKEKPDIVHTHNYYSAVYGILSAKLAKVPIIIHGTHGMLQIDNKSKTYVTKFLSLFTDEFLTVSETLKKELIAKTGISKKRTKAILNGVNLEKFKRQIDVDRKKREIGIKSNMKVVGSIGRLVPAKNYQLLLKTAQILNKHGINIVYMFVGDGPSREELVKLANEYKVNAMFLGERNDIAELLAIMDLFVLTSLSEGMSNTILEAMASGKPVVATNVGNNAELIKDGKTGVLVPVSEPAQLSQAILDVLSDRKRSQKMGEAGYEYIKENFSLERMINAYEETYEYWLRKKGVLKYL